MGTEDPRFGHRTVGRLAPSLPGSVATIRKLVPGRDVWVFGSDGCRLSSTRWDMFCGHLPLSGVYDGPLSSSSVLDGVPHSERSERLVDTDARAPARTRGASPHHQRDEAAGRDGGAGGAKTQALATSF